MWTASVILCVLCAAGTATFSKGRRNPAVCYHYCVYGRTNTVDNVLARKCPNGLESCTGSRALAPAGAGAGVVRARGTGHGHGYGYGYGYRYGRGGGRRCLCDFEKPPAIPFGRATVNGSVVACGQYILSGDLERTTVSVNVGTNSGVATLYYRFYTLQDTLSLYYEGSLLFKSAYSDGNGASVSVAFAGKSKLLKVVVDAPDSRTAWDVFVYCPI